MEEDNLELESRKLDLERKRLDLDDARRKARPVSRLALPLTPTLLGLVAAAVGGLFQLSANRNLERDKFEYQILTKATEQPTDATRRSYLTFVYDLGLIERRAPSVKAWLDRKTPVPRTITDAPAASSTPGFIPLTVTPGVLQEIMPEVRADRAALFAKPIEAAMGQNAINSPQRAAAFLANVAYVTKNLDYTEEDLAAAGLTKAVGDRALYKGRSLLLFGGRADYASVGKGIGLDLVSDPKLLDNPVYAAQAAACWWNQRHLNEKADAGDFGGVVFAVSANDSGLDSRWHYYERALKAFSVQR